MDGDCGYVAAADRVIAPVVRAALHGGCAVIVNGQQGIGCEPVRRLRDHHCWRVSDGADDVSDGTDAVSDDTRKLVSSDARHARGGQQLRGGTLQFCRDALQLCQGTLQLRRDMLQAGWGASASCGDDGGGPE